MIAVLDIVGYNYNLAANQAEDHRAGALAHDDDHRSFPAAAFKEWELAKDNPFIIGEFVWTAMDYLGESGIGAWAYGTPEQAALAGETAMIAMQHRLVDQAVRRRWRMAWT